MGEVLIMSNVTPLSKQALGRLLADIMVTPDIVKQQHDLLVLIYEELENYGHITPGTYSKIVKQVNYEK